MKTPLDLLAEDLEMCIKHSLLFQGDLFECMIGGVMWGHILALLALTIKSLPYW